MKNEHNWSLKGYDIEIDRTRSAHDAREMYKNRVNENVQRSSHHESRFILPEDRLIGLIEHYEFD